VPGPGAPVPDELEVFVDKIKPVLVLVIGRVAVAELCTKIVVGLPFAVLEAYGIAERGT
jgi:hypothetical protein